jgi:hypothetical protein
MREHDEFAVPVLRHDGKEIGPRFMPSHVAGGDCGNRFGARRCVGKRGPDRVLGERRAAGYRQCAQHEACGFYVLRGVPHACPRSVAGAMAS